MWKAIKIISCSRFRPGMGGMSGRIDGLVFSMAVTMARVCLSSAHSRQPASPLPWMQYGMLVFFSFFVVVEWFVFCGGK